MNYQPAMALREYMLEGNRISLLEALLIFGVQSLNAELGRLKKDGYLIGNGKINMAAILRRISLVTRCEAPPQLPYKEITMTEYWIKR